MFSNVSNDNVVNNESLVNKPYDKSLDTEFLDHAQCTKTSSLPVIIAKIIGLLKDLLFTIETLSSRKRNQQNYGKVIGNPDTATKMVVLIHGLNAHPSQMDGHAEAFRKRCGDDVLIFQVQVHEKGNCHKDVATQKIADVVLPFLRQNPRLKLYAHGISNGGRLASLLAIKLWNERIAPQRMMVCANSSPFYGTKMMCDPSSSSFVRNSWKKIVQSPLAGRHSDAIYHDFTWGSQSGRQDIENMRRAAEAGVRFEFDGGFADSKVTPPSFYPSRIRDARYFRPTNIEGHSSIIGSQRTRQVTSACEFLLVSS